jgi:hypothetical protein
MAEWKPIESAPKNGTPILLRFRADLVEAFDPTRARDGTWSLDRWSGIAFVGRHPGIEKDGFDIGWSFAAPVGHGGFPDEWMAGWMHVPAFSPQDRAAQETQPKE